MLQFGYIIVYLCQVQQLGPLDVSYAFVDNKFRVIFAFNFTRFCYLNAFDSVQGLISIFEVKG